MNISAASATAITKFLLGIFLLVAAWPPTASALEETATPAIRVGADFASQPLAGHMRILRDPDDSLSLADIAFGTAGETMVPVAGGIALGYIRDGLWVKLTLEREGNWPAGLFLSVKPTYLDRVDVYVPTVAAPTSAADFNVTRLGDHVSYDDRPMLVFSLAAELDLPDADRADLYLHVRTTSTMALRGWIASAEKMTSIATQQAFRIVALIAYMLTLALVQLFSWVYLRQRLLLVFAVFTCVHALVVLTDSGVLPPGPAIAGRNMVDLITEWAILGSQLANAVFMIFQLDARRNFPRLYRVLLAIAAAFAVGLAAPVLGYYRAVISPVLLTSVALILVFLIANIVLLTRRRQADRILAVIACFFQSVGAVLALGRLTGGLPFEAYTEYAYETGTVLFIFFMTLSILQRASRRDQRRREGEALRITRKAAREARSLVKLRTAELEAAKERAETALAQERAAQQEQLRFVDVVTHQYQTPLAVIRSSAAAILHTLPSEDPNRVRVGRIQAAIKRLLEVLDVSLHRSRVEGAIARADLRECKIAEILEATVARSRELLHERTLELAFNGIGPTDTALLDPDMFGLAVTNLIDNAAKFSAEGGIVQVVCRRDGETLAVDVLDEGIGIPEDEAADISKRYFRASNTGGIHGTGLGLHIVKSAIAAHGGSFTIANRPGKGVVATVILPLAPRLPAA